MKTSLNDLRLIEDYLLTGADHEERCLLEAKLILHPELRAEVYWQQKTYDVVRDYGRNQLKKEIEKIHQTLFEAPEHQSFRQRIMSFFKK